MVACFGLNEGQRLPRFPSNRLAEKRARIDLWELLRSGGLTEGATTLVNCGPVGCLASSRTPNLWIGENPILVTWDEPMPGVGRPWFECPRRRRRCRHVYLLDPIACRRCHRLDYASRHLYRQTPAVHRVARLRRKLGADPRPFAPLPASPPGRRRARHEKLVAKIQAEGRSLVEHLGSIVQDLRRRIRIRKAKGKW